MSTSYIAIYKTLIKPDMNAVIDDIEDYLDTCTKVYDTNEFQYQKLALSLTIKVPLGQAFNTYQPGNYVKIRQDTKNHYFFILKSDWCAPQVLKLDLQLDTINTYKLSEGFSPDGDYSLAPATKVKRRHKDRFKDNTFWNNSTFIKKTDITSEGLNPVLYKTSSAPLEDKITSSNVSTNFYLVYRTPNNITESNQALEVALVAKDNVIIGGGSAGSVTWTRTDFTENKIYYYFGVDNPSGKVNCAGTDYTINDPNTWFILFKNNGSDLKYKIYNKSGGLVINWTNTSQVIFKPTSTKIRSLFTETLDTWTIMNAPYQTLNVGQRYLAKLDSIDRTDSKICKIIELPYLPADFEWTEDTLTTIPDGWTLNGKNELILTNPYNEFLRTITPINITLVKAYYTNTSTSSEDNFKNILYQNGSTAEMDRESKLLHSDFYNFKLLYDNFSSQICFERILINNLSSKPYLHIWFKPSNQVTSSLLFTWQIYNQNSQPTNIAYTDIGDYDRFLISNRNNEVTCLTNTYLDYMRNNYNYDQKNATRSAVSGFFNLGSSVVQGAVSGSLLPGAGTAAGAIVGAVTGTINAISNTINGERSLQQKQDQLASQATTVAGANDLDLLNAYNRNKLWINVYVPSEEILKQVYELFRNYGYATNENYNFYGRFTTSRFRWNFLQADAVIKLPVAPAGSGFEMTNEVLDDIKAKYAEGVTFYHKCTVGSTTRWDLLKEYENWETSLFGI